MIPGVNVISGKASIASVNGAGGGGSVGGGGVCGGGGVLCVLWGVLGDSKEHIVWLKTDLNVAQIITVQDYKYTKINVWMKVHIYSVKAKCIWVKDIMATRKGQSQKKLS